MLSFFHCELLYMLSYLVTLLKINHNQFSRILCVFNSGLIVIYVFVTVLQLFYEYFIVAVCM